MEANSTEKEICTCFLAEPVIGLTFNFFSPQEYTFQMNTLTRFKWILWRQMIWLPCTMCAPKRAALLLCHFFWLMNYPQVPLSKAMYLHFTGFYISYQRIFMWTQSLWRVHCDGEKSPCDDVTWMVIGDCAKMVIGDSVPCAPWKETACDGIGTPPLFLPLVGISLWDMMGNIFTMNFIHNNIPLFTNSKKSKLQKGVQACQQKLLDMELRRYFYSLYLFQHSGIFSVTEIQFLITFIWERANTSISRNNPKFKQNKQYFQDFLQRIPRIR